MSSKTELHILIAGATGLVGQGVLHETLRDADVTKVTVLGRHSMGCSDPRLHEVLVKDFSDLRAVEAKLDGIDACLYCAGAPPIGTPEDRYRHVTVELTTSVASTLARLNPGMRFLYVSGANANPASRFMPLRIKGEAERALQALAFRCTMLRPGGIQPAHGESSPHRLLRALYTVGAPLMGVGVTLAPSLMTSTALLGKAMLALAKMPEPPAVVENAQINALGNTLSS
ncbi:MAG: NAD(P)H-binding protein [Pseudomonadota bacterium]|nr:NAD(P)H-binding protein [Pseudomonadota bacterium]